MAKFIMYVVLLIVFWITTTLVVLAISASSAQAMLNPLSPMSPMNPSNLSSPMNPANPAGIYGEALYGEDEKKKEPTPVQKMEQADKEHPGQNFLKTMAVLLSVFVICSIMYFLI